MKQKFFYVLLTALFGMFGMNAWAQDYEIGNAQALIDFADAVNGGETSANAVLTDNIDLNGIDWTPIGNATVAFEGVFDGQGHKIIGFNATATSNNGGFFGKVSAATIKNFSIDGTFTIEGGKYVGVIAQAVNSTISNVHSSLAISVTGSGSHMGGVVGSTEGGTSTTISNCSFSGSITMADNLTGSIAGVVGYISSDNVINCANHGNITYVAPGANVGGIVAYLNNANASIKNCLNTGTITCSDGTPTYGGAIIGRIKKNFTVANMINDFWLEGSANAAARKDNTAGDVLPSATCVTSAQLASGEVCYMLNENVSGGTNWFQTLNDDDYPWPFTGDSHDPIYMNGRQHCDGTAYEGTSFSNENLGMVTDEHDFVDGFCSYCKAFDENYMTANAEGYFEIGTENKLKWFAAYVNQVKMDANAILVDDISLTDAWEVPIGNWVNSAAFKGHFDGQGHTIDGFSGTSSQNYFGLFGVISIGCIIENFTIRGEITTSYQYAGSIAGYARDNSPVIRNIHSYVNINNNYSGGRQGGILGGSMNGTVVIDRCTYSGTFDGNDAGGSGNYGGIVGYINNNANATLTISNCLFDGKLINTAETPGGCTFGGIIGYIGANPYPTIKNCLSVGTLQSAITGQICGAVKAPNAVIENTYYLVATEGATANGSASTVDKPSTEVNAAQLASGEVAYNLGIAFRQNLGTDATPVLDATHAVVDYISAAGYATLYVPDAEVTVPTGVTAFTGKINGEWLMLNPVEGVIPVKTAVVLKGAEGYYGFAVAAEEVIPDGALKINDDEEDGKNALAKAWAAPIEDNDLKGAAEDIDAVGKYVLAKPGDEPIGFYKATTGTIKAGKAYLEVPEGSSVKGFIFAFGDEDPTGISNMSDKSDQSNIIYNVAGQRIQKMQKGINIVNGKKVMF